MVVTVISVTKYNTIVRETPDQMNSVHFVTDYCGGLLLNEKEARKAPLHCSESKGGHTRGFRSEH